MPIRHLHTFLLQQSVALTHLSVFFLKTSLVHSAEMPAEKTQLIPRRSAGSLQKQPIMRLQFLQKIIPIQTGDRVVYKLKKIKNYCMCYIGYKIDKKWNMQINHIASLLTNNIKAVEFNRCLAESRIIRFFSNWMTEINNVNVDFNQSFVVVH